MVWIKRNLFWVAFGLGTGVLLALGGYYLYKGVQGNSEVDEKLAEIKQKWQRLQSLDPYPNATNIAIARASQQHLREFVNNATKFFAPIPFRPAAGTEFKRVLDLTIANLQTKARQSGVQLPSTNYAFSFESQRNKVQFAPGSMPLLPELLAEVAALSSKLLDAKVSRILDLRRPLTSDDSSQATGCHRLSRDVHQDPGFVMSPYEVTLLCFSSELAETLHQLRSASNCFIIKAIVIETNAPTPGGPMADSRVIDPATGLPAASQPVAPGMPPGRGDRPGRPFRGLPPGGARPTRPGAPGSPLAEAPRTLLDERPFRVTLLVMVVKPLPPR